MSCNYNNCTDVTGNFYAGATFVTLSDPTIFYGNQPIYFYDAANCPAPNCCTPDSQAEIVGSPGLSGVNLSPGLTAGIQSGWKACYTEHCVGGGSCSTTPSEIAIPCSSPSAVAVVHPNQDATVEYTLECDGGQAIMQIGAEEITITASNDSLIFGGYELTQPGQIYYFDVTHNPKVNHWA